MRKRTTTKKTLSTTQKVVLGAGIATGLYLLWNKVLKNVIMPTPSPIDTGATQLPPSSITLSPSLPITKESSSVTTSPTFNPLKVLRKNAPSSPELKYSKMAFNSVIEMARRKKNDHTITQNTKNRLSAIADLPLLDLDSKFGNETEKVAQVILGAKTFTYSAAKQQKINLWKSLGLGNPYL